MRNHFALMLCMLFALVLSSCGGGTTPAVVGPNLTGDWEIAAASTSTAGSTDLIQVRLAQANHDATGSGALFYLEQSDGIHLGGMCAGTGVNTVGVTVADDGALQLSLNEGGNTFTGSGQYTSGVMSGTYAETTGSACPDSGTWTAKKAMPLNASFTGAVSGDPNLVLQLQITENTATHTMTATGTLSGDLVADLSLTGTYIGNAMSAQVTVTIPNQAVQTKPVNLYYSPTNKAIYIYEADGTFDGQIPQD